MPRRDLVTIEDVQRRRATSWEMHYRNRQAVRQLAAQVNVTTYINAIKRNVPNPEIEIDGYLYRPLDVIRGESNAAQGNWYLPDAQGLDVPMVLDRHGLGRVRTCLPKPARDYRRLLLGL